MLALIINCIFLGLDGSTNMAIFLLGINIYMKRYKATVNAAGMWVETILYAQNPAQAYKLFQAIFGAKNVPHQPLQIG